MSSFRLGQFGSGHQVRPAPKLVCKYCGRIEEDEAATGLFCFTCGGVTRWRAWVSLIMLDIVCLVFTVIAVVVFIITYPRELDSFLFGFLAAFLALTTRLAMGMTLSAVHGLIGTRRKYLGATTKTS